MNIDKIDEKIVLEMPEDISDLPHKFEIQCEQCGTPYIITKYHYLHHKHHFCSRECFKVYSQSHKQPNCKCAVCGKPLYRPQYYINKTKNITCSYKCGNKLKKITYAGENNPQYGNKGILSPSYKGDEIIRHGYKKNICENHPFKDEASRVLSHRLIAEEYLLDEINSIEINGKKYLKLDYCVHHIDFDKLNNDINNLCVLKKDDHSAMHISFKNIIRGEYGRIKGVEYKFDINSKDEIIKAFNNYLREHNIYYHMINNINIPCNILGGI